MRNTKVVICGDSSVGKTSILQRILKKDMSKPTETTMGAGFANVIYSLNGEQIPLNLWDTAGQEAYRSLVDIYFRGTDIAVIVFDVTSQKSFDAVQSWIDELYANVVNTDPSLVLIGNKVDKAGSRAILIEDGFDLAKKLHCEYFDISAVSGIGIDDFMQHIATLSVKRINKEKGINMDVVATELSKIEPKSPEQKGICC